ncbi:MAG: MFS transporter [Syntrophales bacterium]|nr:MFS transporter [Syntrophales bacterium]
MEEKTPPMAGSPQPKRPKVNKRTLVLVSVVASFLNPFMAAAVNIALPRIGKEFAMGAVTMSWIAMAFLLSSAVLLVPIGKLADLTGRKRIFFYGNLVVIFASLGCAFSTSGIMLIAFRICQGIGSAMIFGTIMAIVTSAFAPTERGRIIGINVTAVYVALSLAPVLGGFLTHTFGWRSLFFLTVPFALATAIAIHFFIKAEWRGASEETFDYKGSILYVIAMSAFMSGFSRLPNPVAIASAIGGFVGLLIFVRLELRLTFPVLNIRLFTGNRVFAFSNLAALINYAATFAISFVLSLYLQYVKGLSPQDAGFVLMTQPVFMAAFASFSGRLSDRYDSRILSSLGMGVIVIGLFLLIFLNSTTTIHYLITSLTVLGIGFGIFSSPNTNSIMGSVENTYVGVASSTVATMRVTGQMLSLGIATLTIHVFVGDVKISQENLTRFIHSARVIFLVFTVLCTLGVFASLARGKSINYH